MVLTNQDISVYLPEQPNDASSNQLELIKRHQLEQESVSLFAVRWFASCCTAETFFQLNLDYEADSLADIALTATEAIINSKKPLTKSPYPKLILKDGITLISPEQYLSNICFGQFIDAEEQLFLFQLNDDVRHLASLTAILYRPTEMHYDSDKNTNLTKKILRSLDTVQLYIILDYYLGCRTVMESQFQDVFPKTKPSPEVPKKVTGRQIMDMTKSYHAKLVQYAGTPNRKKDMYLEKAWTVLEFINADIVNYKKQMKEWGK